MSLLTIEQIRQAIGRHSPARHEITATTRQAAVAVVLKPVDDHAEVLFILRAEKDGDPWSGHMAFPGGHREPEDQSLRQTAERETLEEIGLDLSRSAEYIGEIDMVVANPRGRNFDMVVSPFVYELKDPAPEFTLNYEVADILWGSLRDMHTGDNHGMNDFVIGGQTQSFPGYGVGDEVVWGLTYRMLEYMFTVLDPDWTSH
ncbi:MAG: CoA pyrophosphatase [Proteobacteria bacterium]|nr:CoA pyrophosphatase [Pseudomonadota bacterium]